MNMINNYAPSFGARYIKDVNILKYNEIKNKYEKAPVSFIEIERGDKDVLTNLNKKWAEAIFMGDIYDDFVTYCKRKFYAVTAQRSDFKNLKSSEILTIGEINEGLCGDNYLEFLQASPKTTHNPYFEYKKCGSGFLDGLKSIYSSISLKTVSLEKVRSFYENNGFKAEDFFRKNYHWSKYI